MPAKQQSPGNCHCTGSCLIRIPGGISTPIAYADARISWGGTTVPAVFSPSSSWSWTAYTGPVWDTGYFAASPAAFAGCGTPFWRFVVFCDPGVSGFNLQFWNATNSGGTSPSPGACRRGTFGGASALAPVPTTSSLALGLVYVISGVAGSSSAALIQP